MNDSESRKTPPVWLMGLSNATLGLNTGIVFFAIPQLLAAEHVSESKIAAITAAAMSPAFWSVVFSPMLDVRFSRRSYTSVLAAASAVCAAIGVLNLHRLAVLEITMLLGTAAATLSSSALGGWFSKITESKEKNNLSKWLNIAVICGCGVSSALGGELVRQLPVFAAATLLGGIIVLPAAIFLVIPAPGPDRRLAAESFSAFYGEVLTLLRRRENLVVLLLFLSPCSAFALTNLLGGLGADFHASARAVSLAGVAGAGRTRNLRMFPVSDHPKRLPLRTFYLANGIIGGVFTLSLILLPPAAWTFALALFGEFLFQAVAFSIQIGIVLELIGDENPLAATTFSLLTAATNVPVVYMMLADGRAYALAE